MKTMRMIPLGLAALCMVFLHALPGSAVETPPYIQSFAKPPSGNMEIIFYGGTGPFRIEMRTSFDPSASWANVAGASVTELRPGVYRGVIPSGAENIAFYRVASVNDGVAELQGWTILAKVSAPANGLYFVPGESPVVTVTLLDTFTPHLSPYEFSTLNLYLYGPQDPQKTVTAVKLLNASTNRAVRPHHYIDLKTDGQVNNNVLTYQLQPVTDEAPGTYRISVWSVMASDPLQQIMKFADLQIGTATVESPVVANKALDGTPKCAACHEGTISGKTYLHHIDPSASPGSVGNWSLDYEPEKSCKSCHNNEGYAAYRDTNAPGGRVPDPIVRRVHGVHMGADLKLPFNTNSVNGDFHDYTHVEFPADVRDCTKCHLDDRWKTKPSRLACTACHDNVWFGPTNATPTGMENHPVPLSDDINCAFCHPPDTGGFIWHGVDVAIASAHYVPPHPTNAVDVVLTPPANGVYYVAGEKPVASIVFMNDAGVSIGDHTVVSSAKFSAANFYVYGPRSMSVPVLTSKARIGADAFRASVTCSVNGPWAIDGKVLKIGINGNAPQDITITGTPGAVTAAEVVAALNAVIVPLNAQAYVSSGTRVNIKTLIRGTTARIEIYNGDVTTAMGWKADGVVLEPDVTVAASSTAGNDLRPVTDPLEFNDTNVVRTATNILYQLDDVAALAPGTYCAFVYYVPKAGTIAGLSNSAGIGFTTFQIGTSTPEKKIATSCADCHGETIMHLYEAHVHPAQFEPDQCKACHDYGHTAGGEMFKNQGGTSLNGWSGFGAVPISRRVHGVHRGNYLEHPEQVYANATVDTFGHIIFPQDVRNCTKCHSESDTWKQKPSRIACLACHDTDAAKVHGLLMTYIPDPNDPYGPLAQESCEVCHGADTAFSPDKVHSIANPYVPPYPRAPRE